MTLRASPGRPDPLGANWDGRGVNFALFSANAEKIELCLFDERSQREVARVELVERTGDVWHGYLADARPGTLYGYRVYGPYDPRRGHRFNHHKLLLDPYARALTGHLRWSDANFAYRVGSPRADLSFDRRDNQRGVPKCRVVDPAFGWGADRPPEIPWSETLIYETHLKSYTARHPAVPERLRGTAAGFAEEASIEHLRRLGVNAVEFLPVQAALSSRWISERGLTDYWGYASVGFFAPDPRYLASHDPAEFRRLVSRLHAAGIEVILDVVYNHSGEGNHLGPTLVFRGIDNASYYRLSDNAYFYDDVTGTGNTLNFAHPAVIRMAMDSLRLWVEEYHVDGFRFDLMTTLARDPREFNPGAGFLAALRQDPVLAAKKLIAEPWDLGRGGYRLGQFGAPMLEWNDRYRNWIRRFWRADPGQLAELGWRITGSADIFESSRRRPWASVNYIASHDGLTLFDLVAYEKKHNEANGENNKDGITEDFGTNYGIEGPSDDDAITALRRKQRRNMLATLFLSQGTPMLLGGDELGRTQRGNNNAWCQDNEISWYGWHELRAEQEADIDFLARLVRFRLAHPVLRAARYLHGRTHDGERVPDLLWLGPDGAEFTHEQWHAAAGCTVGMLLNGRAGVGTGEDGRLVRDACLLVILHAASDPVSFTLPERPSGDGWILRLDTAREPPWLAERVTSATLALAARSVVVLERRGGVGTSAP